MSGRQRIFIEATPLINTHISGVGQVLLETSRALDNDRFTSDYEINLFVPVNEIEKMSKYSFKNINIVSLPIPHKFLSLFSRLPFAIPLDLLLGKGVYIFPNFRNWNLLFSKSLTYIHDVCFAIYPQYIQPKNLVYLRKYIPLWLRRTDKIVTVSESAKLEIAQHLNVKKSSISVVENTVNGSFYTPQSKTAIAAIKKKYELNKYFLFVGNIEPRKNLENLITAFEQANIKEKTTLFIVGGDGWLNEAVYKQIEKAKSLGVDVRKNTSYVPDEDLPALLSGAQALVLPSWHEGYGLPAVQAVACGTVALCADIPALQELTVKYGRMMELFKPDDTKALSKLFEKYASDEKARAVQTAVKRNWDDVADELLAEVATLKRSIS